ncbi:3-oxoacyl-ACP synthase III family protein [Nocardia sp. NPDC088792]|uniref:3-oxoacyl-ACP synthase III family protein n=1 Tax=Nocardia sp. NPDC088792 TaxID=3364332 RepID=UPI00380FAA76
MIQQSIGIISTGSYVPDRTISNAELAARTGTSPEWIELKTQIRSRRYAAPDQAASDLAVLAGRRALTAARLSANDIDYLIVSTSTGDSPQPPTAALVQHALQAHRAACLDINVVCSGFVYALELAHALLTLHPGGRALVIAADVYSRILDFSDPRTAVLFADGAGAAVVGPVPGPYGIERVLLRSFGNMHHLLGVPAGGSRSPASHATVDGGAHYFKMDGHATADFLLDILPPLITEVVHAAGFELDDIEHVVPHQPNGRLIDDLAHKAGLDHTRIHRTIDTLGNMGSASIAVTLDRACAEFTDGDLILLIGFGGGMAAGACLLRWAQRREL